MSFALLKTASLALLALRAASALTIDKAQLVHRETVHAVNVPEALGRLGRPALSVLGHNHLVGNIRLLLNETLCIVLSENLRQNLTAVMIRPAYTCDFFSNTNCNPDGDARYGLTFADSASLAGPPFVDGWHVKMTSLRCYMIPGPSIWAATEPDGENETNLNFERTIVERSDSGLEEREREEKLEISKVAHPLDTAISRRGSSDQVYMSATDNLLLTWFIEVLPQKRICWNLGDHLAHKLYRIEIPKGIECDLFSNESCNPDGDARYGFTFGDNQLLAAPPFVDGWDQLATSIKCYQMALNTPPSGHQIGVGQK